MGSQKPAAPEPDLLHRLGVPGVAAIIIWAILLGVVGTRQTLRPGRNSVLPAYLAAGQQWLVGRNIYVGEAFRYSPAVGGAFACLSLLPPRFAALLWLLLNAAVFLGGFYWWARVALPVPTALQPRPPTPVQHIGALLFVVSFMAVGSFNNLQANPLVIGLLLMAVASAVEQRWNSLTVCIVAATLLKIYPLSLGLVFLVLYPRPLWWRLPVGLLLGFLLPFVMQHPTYVAQTYQDWAHSLLDENRHWRAHRDLLTTLEYWMSWDLPNAVVMLARGCGALAVGLAAMGLRRVTPADGDRPRLMLALGLVIGWIMLLGPNSESATYILLAPIIAWGLLEAFLSHRPGLWALFAVAYGLQLLANMAIWFPWGGAVQQMGLQPLGALLATLGVCWWALARNGAIRFAVPFDEARDR